MSETIISEWKYGELSAGVEAPMRLCDLEEGKWLQDTLPPMAKLFSSCHSDAAGLRTTYMRPTHWTEQTYECMAVSKGTCSTMVAYNFSSRLSSSNLTGYRWGCLPVKVRHALGNTSGTYQDRRRRGIRTHTPYALCRLLVTNTIFAARSSHF
jgi:hypothetical protein